VKLVAENNIDSIMRILLIIQLLFLVQGCEMKEIPIAKIDPIETYSLIIPEPSGLTLADDKLWIVSDRESTIYKTDLKGNIEYSFRISESDLEGITIFNDSLLAIVIEKKREVVVTDLEGNVISKYSLKIDGNKNSGLEGITYNPSNEHFYIVNEKDPVLVIETDKNFKELGRRKINEVRDLSGISFSKDENCLWLLSDEDQKITKYSLDGEIIIEYKIPVEQPEGIAISDDKTIYIVSDRQEKLFLFELSN